MSRQTRCFPLLFVVLTSLPVAPTFAQFRGSRAGLEESQRGVSELPHLDRDVAEGFIAIDGRAEVRVQPTEIRIVLAVTSEGETAQACQQAIKGTVDKLNEAWAKLEIAPEAIVEDFIAVLPLYEWDLQKRGDVEVGVEKRTGFRIQTNATV